MASIVALTGVVTTPASAQPVQVADWRQSIPGAVGSALDRAPNGDYVVVGIESLSKIDPTYGEIMTLQRYSRSGQPVWSHPVRIPQTVAGLKPSRVLVDANDNIVVLANEADYNYRLCALNDPTCTPGSIDGLFNAWWIVQKYSPAGIRLWERRTFQVKSAPIQGAFDPTTGDIFVLVDANKGAARTTNITRLSSAGELVWSIETKDITKPGALALSSEGTVLVAGANSLGLSINEFAPLCPWDGGGATRSNSLYREIGYWSLPRT
ncbi:MAG: hypothetical protein HP496_13980 [Nitrospira sp.]|nr:hypothetical protein [Nitrospira sp.]